MVWSFDMAELNAANPILIALRASEDNFAEVDERQKLCLFHDAAREFYVDRSSTRHFFLEPATTKGAQTKRTTLRCMMEEIQKWYIARFALHA